MAQLERKSKAAKIVYPQWPKKGVRGFIPIHPSYVKVGAEVLYVPDGVESIHDVMEGGVRRGFITMHSPDKKIVWCRFFKADSWELDTVEKSEKVHPKDL